jgi:hypothetical protein
VVEGLVQDERPGLCSDVRALHPTLCQRAM